MDVGNPEIAALDPAARERLIGARVGNYSIVECLGEGAMGAVYVAEHPTINRRVAVKFLAPHLCRQPQMADRFVAEAQAVAQIQHSNVVEIYDYGQLDGRPYYIMELLDGRDFKAVLEDAGRLSAEEALPYVGQICAALEAAHSHGIVHRDLKPSNIFVVNGPSPQVKLLDFGIAKTAPSSRAMRPRTLTGVILGTPSYISPEQASGNVDEVTPRSDIYSLGVLLYEALGGRLPFTADSPLVLLAMHLRNVPPSLKELEPSITDAVVRVVESCLAKRPQDRPQSALALSRSYFEAVFGEHVAPPVVRETIVLDGPGTAAPLSVNESATPGAPIRPPDAERAPLPSADSAAPPEPPAARVPPSAGAATITTGPRAQATEAPSLPVASTEAAAPVAAPPPQPPIVAGANAAVPAVAAPASSSPPSATKGGAPSSPNAAARKPRPRRVLETDEALPAVAAKKSDEEAEEPLSPPLEAAEETAFNRLLRRMKRRGDFPAFARSIYEISRKAVASGRSSARQLADSIMKDYSLTTKLVRLVNTAYYERLTGPINSVSRAVVLLGFDQVRMASLSLTLFRDMEDKEHTAELQDMAVRSLVSGELAKKLASRAGLEGTEEVFLCSMFCNMGKHLTIYYLPEMYTEICKLMESEELDEESAAKRVLGITYEKIGVAITRSWRFSERLVAAIHALPKGRVPKPVSPLARLQVVASFANELCEIVSTQDPEEQQLGIPQLLYRYGDSLPLKEKDLPKLLEAATDMVNERYAPLLGLDGKRNRFMRRARKLARPDEEVPPPEVIEGAAEEAAAGLATDAASGAPEVNPTAAAGESNAPCADAGSGPIVAPAGAEIVVSEEPPPAIEPASSATATQPDGLRSVAAPLPPALSPAPERSAGNTAPKVATPAPGKVGADAQPRRRDAAADRIAQLRQRVDLITAALREGDEGQRVPDLVLDTLHEVLNFDRVLLFILELDQQAMGVRAARGTDADKLLWHMNVPVHETSTDQFSRAIFGRKDLWVEDTAAPATRSTLPDWYHGQLGAPAFGLLSVALFMRPVGAVYLAGCNAGALCSVEERHFVERLRNLLTLSLRQRR